MSADTPSQAAAKWKKVSALFEENGLHCRDCRFNVVRGISGPTWGDQWHECTLGERGNDKLEQCEAFNAWYARGGDEEDTEAQVRAALPELRAELKKAGEGK